MKTEITDNTPHEQFLADFAEFTKAANAFHAIQAGADVAIAEMLTKYEKPWETAKAKSEEAKAKILEAAKHHPEWFGEKKTLETIHGKIAKRIVPSLEISNPEETIKRIRKEFGDEAGFFIHSTEAPNLETLKTLEEATLKKLRVEPKEAVSWTATPVSAKLGSKGDK